MSSVDAIEITVARLDERLKGFQSAFSQIADDQRRMAESYEELVKSNQRISLVEAELVTLKKSTETLWMKFDAHEAITRKATGHVLFEGIKLVLVIVASIALAKYGVHVL